MPRGDGTGPDGTYKNCMPARDKLMYERQGRGLGNQRKMPGMGGRGIGRMNRFYSTSQPGWQRDAYQTQQPQKEESNTLERLIGALEKILERLDKK